MGWASWPGVCRQGFPLSWLRGRAGLPQDTLMLFGGLFRGQEDQLREAVQICQLVEGLENQQHGHEPQKQVNWKERGESEPGAGLADRQALPSSPTWKSRVAHVRWQAWGAHQN